MSEQFAFEKPGGHRRTVDLDETPVVARTKFMDRSRDDFLACAGLAGQQHGRIVGGHSLHLGKDFAQAPTAPHNRLQERVFGERKLAHIGFIETTKSSPPSRYTSISVNVRGKVGHYAHVSLQMTVNSLVII